MNALTRDLADLTRVAESQSRRQRPFPPEAASDAADRMAQ